MKKLKRGYGNLKNPLYLNANIILAEAIRTLKNKQKGLLQELNAYELVTSILTRYEVIQNLRLIKSISYNQSKLIYFSILKKYQISEIRSIHKFHILTDDYIDKLSKTNLSFKDGLHIMIAKTFNMTVCTHDKKMSRSRMDDKEKLYDKIFKPEDLI